MHPALPLRYKFNSNQSYPPSWFICPRPFPCLLSFPLTLLLALFLSLPLPLPLLLRQSAAFLASRSRKFHNSLPVVSPLPVYLPVTHRAMLQGPGEPFKLPEPPAVDFDPSNPMQYIKVGWNVACHKSKRADKLKERVILSVAEVCCASRLRCDDPLYDV